MVGQQANKRAIEEVIAEIQQIDPEVFPTVEWIQVAGDTKAVAGHVGQRPANPYPCRGTAFCRVSITFLALTAALDEGPAAPWGVKSSSLGSRFPRS